MGWQHGSHPGPATTASEVTLFINVTMSMLNGLIFGSSCFLNLNYFFQQENLMYVADPESFEVNTKDMDSTLSRASRAIKKTSKKVTRAFSFSKTPKRALRMALSSSHSSEGRSPPSSGKLAVSRLSSTSSLAGIPSPSLVSLPSFFDRRSHTLSRSTTHLI